MENAHRDPHALKRSLDMEPSGSSQYIKLSRKEENSEDKNKQTQENNQKQVDDEYFRAYSELDIHNSMLADYVRTFTYRKAILGNFEKFYGKVVLDVGCGTGILSMFCAQAGARMVYAVDASGIIHHAETIIRQNNFQDRITFIKGKIEEVTLPEKVDIIISEWMGYMLLYETMLPSVLYARDKWLKPNGYIFPERAVLYMAPCSDFEGYSEAVDTWKEIKDMYEVDMSVMMPIAQKQYADSVSVKLIHPEDVMAHSSLIFSLNLLSVEINQLSSLSSSFEFDCFGTSTVHGFALWFIVTFPGDIDLSTSPYSLETHWQHTFIQVDPLEVHQGSIIKGSVSIEPNHFNYRFLDVKLKYHHDGRYYDKKYHINDSLG